MLAHFGRRQAHRGLRKPVALVATLLAAGFGSSACDKMPLIAPTGTVITLFTSSSVMSPNDTIEITATLVENGVASSSGGGTSGGGSSGSTTATAGAGTPVHNGTLVTFTTTIGSIDPKEARTHNGQVNVRLHGDGRNGVAKVVAFSGGAKSAELEISIGAAAADRVVLSATPSMLPSVGGSAQLAARVEDVSGNPLTGVPVTFTTTAGTISAPTVNTDDTGTARALLTTSQKADVTASVGSKSAKVTVDLAQRTGIAITPPASAPSAGSPATFTVSVAGAANIRDVTVNWGDGASTSLGAIAGSAIISHVFTRDGNFSVTATAIDASGNRESVSTVVTVLPLSPVSVTLTASSTSPVTNQTVTFTATTGTIPAGTVILRYIWNFGDGSSDTTTTSNNASTAYATAGIKNISVRVVLSNGAEGTGNTTIVVTNPNPVSVALSAVPNAATRAVTIVRFTATVGALPPGVSIVRYDWSFGNGATATGGSPSYDYQYPSTDPLGPITRTVTVTVVLSNGTTAVGQALVTVT